MADTTTRTRGRRIELLAPFSYAGHKIDVIDIKPPKFDHVLRWQARQLFNGLTLLAEMTGLTEGALRQMEYPDAEIVLKAFMDSLPSLIRDDINSGEAPMSVAAASQVGLTPVDDDDDAASVPGTGFNVEGRAA
jgi:hypothetical protein